MNKNQVSENFKIENQNKSHDAETDLLVYCLQNNLPLFYKNANKNNQSNTKNKKSKKKEAKVLPKTPLK